MAYQHRAKKAMKVKISNFFDIAHAGYVRKWITLGILIGIVAGLGSIAFYWAIKQVTMFMLGLGAGYTPPMPAGEGHSALSNIAWPWMIPIITGVGGLISGLIVYKFAPEAEGHGTDAAIDAFHNKGGFIRRRVPIVKIIASAITIGSGGSAGREGPTAQIAAGAGSVLADFFKLTAHDRRIAMASGIGAGIGSIFKAPLGGAILSMEILYRHDFETEALIPSFIASVIGYSIFGSWHGWIPIFGMGSVPPFHRAQELISYATLGVICGLIGIAYGRGFYGMRDLFRKIKIPNWSKPAVGGLLVGIMGMFLPQILGMGYGWLQFAIDGNFAILPVEIMLAVVIGKILATGLSIGSGGSGGVFAPGLVIGGMTGAVVWSLLHNLPAITPSSPAAFVVVGMMALFGGIAKAPLAVILMVSEMTMDYTLLMPSMLACVISYVITGKSFIYENQVTNRAESPAHRPEYSVPLLQMLKVKEAMVSHVVTVLPKTSIAEVASILKDKKIDATPVVDNGELLGIVATLDVVRVHPDKRAEMSVDQIMSRRVVVTYPDESLYEAMRKMSQNNISHLPVVEYNQPRRIVGIITIDDIVRLHSLETEHNFEYRYK